MKKDLLHLMPSLGKRFVDKVTFCIFDGGAELLVASFVVRLTLGLVCGVALGLYLSLGR